MNRSSNLDSFFTHLKLVKGSFIDIAHPYKLFASKYIRYYDMIFLNHSSSYIYIFFLAYHLGIAWHIPPRMPFSAISNISILVNNSNFISVFFKQACHAKPSADKKWARSSSYISIHLLLKFSNPSASNNILLWTNKSW